MPWPAITDFTDAIQNPKVCFSDPQLAELATGRVETEVERHPVGLLRQLRIRIPGCLREPQVCRPLLHAGDQRTMRIRYGQLTNYLSHTLPPSLGGV